MDINNLADELRQFDLYIQRQYQELEDLKAHIKHIYEMLSGPTEHSVNTSTEPDVEVPFSEVQAVRTDISPHVPAYGPVEGNAAGWKSYKEPLYTANSAPGYLAVKNADKPQDEQTMVLSTEMLPQGYVPYTPDDGEAPTTKMDMPVEYLFAQSILGAVWKHFPEWRSIAAEDGSLCITSGRLYFYVYPQNPVLLRLLAERPEDKRMLDGIQKLNRLQGTWEFKYDGGMFYGDCYLTTDIPLSEAETFCCEAVRRYFRAEL